MGFWGKIFNVGGAGIAAPIEAIGGLIDDIHTSKEEKDAAKIVMERLRQEPGKVQATINAIEAQHRSIFVAGWRPYIGWVCGFALAYIWLVRPIFADVLSLVGFPLSELEISTSDVILLLGPLLGLGTLRTSEKLGKVSK